VLGRSAAALLLALTLASPALAQRDTTVVAGAHYRRGALHRFLFGTDYRSLWTTPVSAPVLDLTRYGGGLTPTTAGGGFQTKSLRFRGADGFLYGFRSVDKDPSIVPPELDDTFVEDLIKDQTSSQHPGAPPVVAALMEAAGVLHTEPMLVILPDDPALGQFRERFAGTLGFLERRAVVQPGVPPFAGAREIINTDSLAARRQRGPDHRVDERAYLAARLVDILIGDWDRHRGQWTWARFSDQRPTSWVPIPEDRDQALVRFDGLMLGVARSNVAPQLVNYGERFAGIVGQTWNGRDIDREFLTPLAASVWDSVAADVQRRITDSVIDAAVGRMPPEWHALDGPRLARALRARRDHLGAEARRFHGLLSREAELHATNAAEDVATVREADGSLTVRMARRGDAAPYAARRFIAGETEELRLYLYGGEDRVVVTGNGPGRITVRVVGGGNAVVADSSRTGNVTLYASGGDRAEGVRRVPVEREEYDPPGRPSGRPQRDWGRWTVPQSWVAFGPDLGVFAGAGLASTRYRFRHYPYGNRWGIRAGYATSASTFRIAVDGTIYREASHAHVELFALASGIEVLHYHGLGNDTRRTQPSAYYRVTQQLYRLQGVLVLPLSPQVRFSVGPTVAFSHTEAQPGRIIADSQPYGAADFGSVGLTGAFSARSDVRDSTRLSLRGASLTVSGAAYPDVWDARRAYGEVTAVATAHITARGAPFRPTLAFRAGAKQALGTYPFHAAAFIGDAATVRLGRKNRYGGEAAAWGGSELRLRLGRHGILVPGDLGVFGLADAGRVFVDGESSDTWHTAAGGGVWLSFARPGNLLAVAVAASRERTALYVSAGFAY